MSSNRYQLVFLMVLPFFVSAFSAKGEVVITVSPVPGKTKDNLHFIGFGPDPCIPEQSSLLVNVGRSPVFSKVNEFFDILANPSHFLNRVFFKVGLPTDFDVASCKLDGVARAVTLKFGATGPKGPLNIVVRIGTKILWGIGWLDVYLRQEDQESEISGEVF